MKILGVYFTPNQAIAYGASIFMMGTALRFHWPTWVQTLFCGMAMGVGLRVWVDNIRRSKRDPVSKP